MRRTKPTLFAVITDLFFAGICLLAIYFYAQVGYYLPLAIFTAIGLLLIWDIVSMLRQGLRPPTHFERFEHRHSLRAAIILIVGGAIMVLGELWIAADTTSWPALVKVVAMLALFLAYIAATLRALGRTRNRIESVGAYKQRTGYQGPPDEV